MAYPLPNWAQAVIANALGLPTDKLSIAIDNDQTTVYQHCATRDRYRVDKKTGRVTVEVEKGS